MESLEPCLEKVRSSFYDALLLDIDSFSKEPEALLAVLREFSRLVPIIVIAGQHDSALESRIRQERIFYYMMKPVSRLELIEVLVSASQWARKNTQRQDWEGVPQC